MFGIPRKLVSRVTGSILLLLIGYCLGSVNLFSLTESQAQPPLGNEDQVENVVDLSDQSVRQVQAAHQAMAQAMESMRLEGKLNLATVGMNPLLVFSGGGDAIRDLESGSGVDPVTFAQLYAGMAVREVGDEITRDEQNRLLYKGRLIRMYSVERIQSMYEMTNSILEKRVLP